MIEFHLPSLGSDMDEGKLLQWNIVPGQQVKKGDVIAVVDTSKAAVDLEVWVDGTVHQLVTEVGQTIPVGTVMATLLAPGEAAPEPGAAPALQGVGRATPAPSVSPVTPAAAAPAARPGSAPVTAPGVTPMATEVAESSSRRRASPAARQRAIELGVDLARIDGTGPEGAITRADVEQAAASPRVPAPPAPSPTASPAPSPAAPATTGATAAINRAAEMRKAIAAAMGRSKREIPHYYLSETVPMRAALAWLGDLNAQRPVTARLLPAVLLLKAVALAVRDYPEMNGLFEGGTFRPGAAAHIGVAISLRQGGLVAPALHDAGAQSLESLMRGLADLVKRARAGSLRSSEMADPTITVTNLGDQGVEAVFGVIYPPQVALVGFGRLHERPWVEGGSVCVMPALTASLSADHRVSDGHRGALFLARLRDLLQRPQEL